MATSSLPQNGATLKSLEVDWDDVIAGVFPTTPVIRRTTPVPDPPSTLTLPEAPCSVNFRTTYHNAECQFTIRDTDEGRLLATLAPQAVAETPTPSADWCAMHHVQMTQHTNAKGAWYSHRTPNGGVKAANVTLARGTRPLAVTREEESLHDNA